MTPPAPEESMVAGDPTQRLLTALGRFQRQVSRAEDGASQEAWCDECMNQLIVGIEIALGESWADVKEALTDTARVLQTYEDADMATDCVPFLKDSYEILCLMVGDLIVDNVRSGVMKKWHERYEYALNDLANLGLTLVDDESARDRDVQHGNGADNDVDTFDTPDPFAGDARGESETGSSFDEFISASGGLAVHQEEPEESDGDPFAPVLDNATPFGLPREDGVIADSTILPSLDELLGGEDEIEDDGAELALSNDFTADEPDEPVTANLSEMEEDGFGGDGDLFGTTEPDVDDEAEASEVTEDDEPTPMELDLVAEPEPEIEPERVPEATVDASPAPVAEPEPEPGSALALLKTAQDAMARGNVADAKIFALQLAANMARLEAAEVEAREVTIKGDIEANIEEVGAAERTVSDAEERVRSLEEQIVQCQQEFEGKRHHVQELREEVAAVESTVADLDRQIAELEARRNDERARLAERQTSLDDTVSEESRMQAELDALNEEEGGARENLESARDRVRNLQEKGGTRQADLEAIRLELAARHSAVEDIERTISHMAGPASTPESHGDEQ